jgi:coenzyme F420 hydrogenase subunit beta
MSDVESEAASPIVVYPNPDYHGDAVSNMKTVLDVVLNGLCTGCGTCSAFCEEGAISMVVDAEKGVYVCRLDEGQCNKCGRCLQVCAGLGVDRVSLAKQLSSDTVPDPLLGPVMTCGAGLASDEFLRQNSSSGGLVTALLVHALETGMIDGAVVTRMKGDSPLEAEPFIARTRDEILDAARSKYCPVPVNKVLREIISNDGRYAVVGLPCHIQGIRLAQELDDRVRSRVRFCLGLACHHTPSLLGTEYIISRLGLAAEDVSRIDYRSGTWPGAMRISTKGGGIVSLPYDSGLYWGFLFQRFFYPTRCMMCLDKSSTLSDVSFMDAWNVAEEESGAKAMVIVRTRRGEELVESCLMAGKVGLSRVSKGSVAGSLDLVKATRARVASIEVLRKRQAMVPTDSGDCGSSWRDRTYARVRMLVNALSSNRRLWRVLDLILSIERLARRMKHRTREARSERAKLNSNGKSA